MFLSFFSYCFQENSKNFNTNKKRWTKLPLAMQAGAIPLALAIYTTASTRINKQCLSA